MGGPPQPQGGPSSCDASKSLGNLGKVVCKRLKSLTEGCPVFPCLIYSLVKDVARIKRHDGGIIMT